MTRAYSFIRSHAVAMYFALTFAISWGGVLAIGGWHGVSGTTWQSDPRFPAMVIAMLAGPSLAGLTLTGIVSGRAGLRALLSRVTRWRVAARWYAFALLTAPVVFATVHAALSLIWPAFLPAIVTTRDAVSLFAFGIAGALAVGVCEELGWTGFAVPALRVRHSAFATGLIVGAPWGAWHLLTNDFWIAASYAGDLPVASFVILDGVTLVAGQLVAYRVFMVWLYDQTDSVLLAMLTHASLSACTFVLGPATLTGSALVGYGFALAGAWWTVASIGAVIVAWRSVRADRAERARTLPGDELIPAPLGSFTHAMSIGRAPEAVWPWLVQMGAGNRAGWYSYDALDNGWRSSATRLVPELQHVTVGTVFPALPGVTDGFIVLGVEPNRSLILGWAPPGGSPLVTWAFVLERRGESSTRLIVRARGSKDYRFHGLAPWLSAPSIRFVHFVMQRKQLLGIARRVESSSRTVHHGMRSSDPERRHIA